jgi:tRNA pseudouridine55 synthase
MARRKPAATHGLVVVDKPAGMTSHDVVAQIRRRFNERQVGHAGTLDPDATGVLVIAVGMATRLLRFVTDSRKSYTGVVVLGTETSTLDAAGEVTATFEMEPVTIEQVRSIIDTHLTGEIMQIPPMVSALKVDGRRLHELAREGIEVERAPRPVTIYRHQVVAVEGNQITVEVDCSAGTYIRTLAADLGRLLGGGAHLGSLRRTAVGSFGLAEAGSIEECELLPVETAVRSLTAVVVDADTVGLVANGRVLPAWPGQGPWAVHTQAAGALPTEQPRLIAVYEAFGSGQAKPAVVLPTAAAR